MKSFEELDAWKEGCRLAVDLYTVLRDCRDYGLRDQMTRAAVSIPSNIAEGSDRSGTKELIQFLRIAKGSCAELRTQIYIASRIGVLDSEQCKAFTERSKKLSAMLQNLITALHKRL